ncbi:MAG: PAS-domain containing protein [Sphingobium sp.]|nr:PAS-domain containing protein [Sphingobium sp.]MBP6112266.1 PAS-domain containing protein [Sphingobium sp.]MBP8670671.1 PAS-domain containing protein [Sphingobium sp.]MBP9156861.1 PAS-domain containing protein [Sphingobium sp.]MCC6481007.1 PAS-domain containing protein [Sphingomonadaceae bacterium]
MVQLSATVIVLAGAVMALWLAAALYAVMTGLKLRQRGQHQREQADRLAALLQSAPAVPMLIRADGRIEAPARLAGWFGLAALPHYLSELLAEDGCLATEDRSGLGADILSAQRGAKSFSRAITVRGSSRSLLVKGALCGPDLANPGAAILWLFDATESQARIAMLETEGTLLHDALEALSGLIEAAPLPMWHRNDELRLGLVNSAYVRAVEARSAAEVIEHQIELFETIDGLPPLDAARIAMDKGEVLTRVVPATLGGERRMMQVVEVPMGRAGVAGYAIDRQDYESARTEQARTVASQRDMLDRLTAAVAQFGPDKSLIFWNQAFVSLFALHPEHLVDRPEFERVLDQMREGGRIPEHRDFPAWRSERRGWFTAQEASEENWLLADGTHLRVFAQPMPDGGLLLVFEDRTEQVQLSSARDTLLRVRTATFDSLFEGIGVFAADGRLHLWNNRFRTIWGVEEEALAAHPRIDDFMTSMSHRLARPPQASLVRELMRSCTVDRKQRNGRIGFADGRTFDFAAIPLPDGNALITMLDVTDSRRIEHVLREQNEALAEADKVKTAFLANMSYDLRTPLTSIGGFAEMMNAGYAGELPQTAKDYVAAILDSSAKLSGLIDTVLDLTQGEAGTLPLESAPVDLAGFIAACRDRWAAPAAAKKIELVVDIKPSTGRVMADEKRLAQALDKLMENAIRVVPEGGRISLHSDGQVGGARLIVSDNGPGMDAKTQARAFDRFSRMNDAERGDAQGLGLPLARQLVEAHGGTLSLISEPGEGTVFTMDLPRGELPRPGKPA